MDEACSSAESARWIRDERLDPQAAEGRVLDFSGRPTYPPFILRTYVHTYRHAYKWTGWMDEGRGVCCEA